MKKRHNACSQTTLVPRPSADGRTGDTGTGSGPLDATVSHNSRFLYVLLNGTHSIGAFAVQADGSLAPLAGASGIPAGAAGIASR